MRTDALQQLTEKLPVDAVPGVALSVTDASVPGSQYEARMSSFSKEFGANAAAYNNETKPGFGPKRYPRGVPIRVISPVGFPPNVTVTYGIPPSGAAFIPSGVRDVKFFVLHSFGHGWTATPIGGGWLNSAAARKGAVPYQDGTRTIYIARGTDTENMAHFTRFAAGFRACVSPTAKASAHFFIDRNGNLTVLGDCNMILATSNSLNPVQLGVELEEAFYVLEDPKRTKATWHAGGNPAGTAGNVKYFSYSAAQLLTLSVLVKKLETAYPVLRARNVHIQTNTVSRASAPGYTMHNAIAGAHHVDISPNFLDPALWDTFFALVDTHAHINPTNVFIPATQYSLGESGLAQVAVTDNSNGLDATLASMVTTITQTAARADRMLQSSREQQYEQAARGAAVQASRYQARAAGMKRAAVSVTARTPGQGSVSEGAALTYGTAVI